MRTVDAAQLHGIIVAIEAVLRDSTATVDLRRDRLQILADEYWKAVFPEYETPAWDELSEEDLAEGWRLAATGESLNQFPRHRAQISVVLNWPASGGTFPFLSSVDDA